MNKIAAGLFASLALFSSSLYADVLGVHAGVGMWQADFSGDAGIISADLSDLGLEDDENNNFLYVALEHPIPLLPNIRLQQTTLEIDGQNSLSNAFRLDKIDFPAGEAVTTDIDFTHTDAVFYYEILDNWVNLDLGLTIRSFDGDVKVTSSFRTETAELSEMIPLVYADARFDLPFSGWSVGATAHAISYSDSTVLDATALVRYTFDLPALDFGVELGYRMFDVELDEVDDLDADIKVDGPYAAVSLHF